MEKRVLGGKSMPSPRCCADKRKKGLLARAVERCRSLGRWPRPRTPAGCFAVVVGPGKERFAVRVERANHPHFRALLEEAEAEHGFPRPAAAGPLVLPCTAEEFRRVMSELEQEEGDAGSAPRSPVGRLLSQRGGARAGAGEYQKMSPARVESRVHSCDA